MKQQDWTEQLRRQLAQHEEPVPDGLWDAIEQQLDRRPKTRLVVLRRLVAAAASILLLLGLWQMLRTESGDALVASRQEALPDTRPQSLPEEGGETAPVPEAAPGRRSSQESLANLENPENPESLENLENPESPKYSESPENPESPASQHRPSTPSREDTWQEPAGSPAQWPAGKPRPTRRTPVLQAHASNLLAYSGGTTTVEPMLMTRGYMGNLSNNLARTAPVYLSDHEDRTEHSRPFTLGLTVRVPLTDRWWLGTGLSYSRLSSTFTHRLGSNILTNRQRLHYLGLPLHAGYTFWQRPSLSAYASAGGEAQLCLAASIDNGHIGRDRMQFSFMAAAGMEYAVLPQLAFYVQPGVRYYADNGSRILNIYKERPWQFELQLGLRLTLK